MIVRNLLAAVLIAAADVDLWLTTTEFPARLHRGTAAGGNP